MMTRLKQSLVGIFAIAQILAASVSQAEDEQMLALANSSGCFICHQVSPDSTSELPLAPSYQEIALRYNSDSGAYDRLLDRVMHGTVYREQAWAGKVGMSFMPPNVNISRETGSALVHWILSLDIDPALAQRLVRYDRMLSLSTTSGCSICHGIDPVTELRVVPLAPSYREIAARYRDKADARKNLVDSVVLGTQAKQKTWENVNMRFMPPNVALKREDAEELVDWILSLDTAGVRRIPEPPVSME